MWYHFYTKVNLLFGLFLMLTKNRILHTMFFTNSMAIFTSYHSAIIVHKGFPVDFMVKHNQSWLRWLTNDIVGHVVPLFYTYMKKDLLDRQRGVLCGLSSALVHCTWTQVIHGGWSMDNAYLQLPLDKWKKLWMVAVATHVLSGVALQIASDK
jgi:hypothetical protein